MERLNKYLAHAGVGSRRHCEELIVRGRVAVNGHPVRELGTKVEPTDTVCVDGQPLRGEKLVYWLLNKPRGYLCTNFDPAGRPRAIDLLPHVSQRVYPVGRLDEDSEGLVLLTNDGELANRLTHPRFGVEKTYRVQVAGHPKREDMEQLLKGVWLSDGHVRARRVRRLKSQGESTWLEIVLNEGKNREIRRMLARLNHKVLVLRRISIGPVQLDKLRRGKARRLKLEELEWLRDASKRGPKQPDDASATEVHELPGDASANRRRNLPGDASANRQRNLPGDAKRPWKPKLPRRPSKRPTP